MGIKKLKTFLKDNFKEVKLSTYSGKKVAVDIFGFIFRYKTVSEEWNYYLTDYLRKLKKNYNIKLLLVFDGKALDVKKVEQDRRKKTREDARNKLENVKNDFEEMLKTGVESLLLQDIIQKLTKPKLPSQNVYSFIIENELNLEDEAENAEREVEVDNVTLISDYIKKMETQSKSINMDDIKLIKNFCDENAICYIEAEGEAEHVCAWLCKNRLVDAVYSEDSDLIPLQCPRIISRPKSKNSDHVLEFVYEDFLKEFKLDAEQIIDWCILCGTDYNETIPKFGIKRSLQLIQTYKSLDEIQQKLSELNISEEDFDKLNFKKIRDIFKLNNLLEKTLYYEEIVEKL
jgi:5'-3' exonuclease